MTCIFLQPVDCKFCAKIDRLSLYSCSRAISERLSLLPQLLLRLLFSLSPVSMVEGCVCSGSRRRRRRFNRDSLSDMAATNCTGEDPAAATTNSSVDPVFYGVNDDLTSSEIKRRKASPRSSNSVVIALTIIIISTSAFPNFAGKSYCCR